MAIVSPALNAHMNNEIASNKKFSLSPRHIIYLLILFAFALRLYRLDYLSLRGDEAFSVVFSRQTPAQVIDHLLHTVEPHPPLYNFVLHYWMRGAGDSEFSIRYLSLFFSVLTAPLLWQFGRRLLGRKTAYLGLFLLTINPFDIFYAQEARMYTLFTFLGLTTAYLAFQVTKRRSAAPLSIASFAITYALIGAAAVYTHYYALFLILFENLFIWSSAVWQVVKSAEVPKKPQKVAKSLCALSLRGYLAPWLTAQTISLALIAPWLILIFSTLTDYRGIGTSPALWDAFYRVIAALSVQAVPPALANAASLLTTAFILLGVIRVILPRNAENRDNSPRTSLIYLVLYFTIPILAVWIASLSRPIFLERYLAFVLPAFLLLIAFGASWRSEINSFGRNSYRDILLIAYLAIVIFSLNNLYHNPRYAKSGHWREVIGFIAERAAPGDIVVQNYHDPAPAYYLRDRVPNTVRPVDANDSLERKERDLQALLNEYERIWLIPDRNTWWDAANFVERWLDRECAVALSRMVYGMPAKLYLTPQAIRDEMNRVDARVNDTITLLGYQLHSAPEPPMYHAGEIVSLSLYWECTAPVAADYTVFTHLVDAAGVLRGQRDNPPARGAYPTSLWQVGQMIIDPYEIEIAADAPPGDYQLRVGMYDPQTGQRVPIRRDGERVPDDSLVLTTLQVRELID